MAKDVGDLIGTAIGRVARETVQSVAPQQGPQRAQPGGSKGLAAGAGLASLAPLAFKGAKGAKNLMSGSGSGSGPVGKAKEKLEGNVKDKAKEGAKDALPFGGGKKKGEARRRQGPAHARSSSPMDVAVPIETVYNQWTQFEEWPKFMHRLESVTPGGRDPRQLQDEDLGQVQGVHGRDRGAASRRADQVEGHRGHHAHRRRDVPRARAAPDARRGQHRRRSPAR